MNPAFKAIRTLLLAAGATSALGAPRSGALRSGASRQSRRYPSR
ncbi:hypothetical protein [Neorhizobium sp. NCHU2750]|nr:hypothetical protein NCHU2750_32190 [Neorhizobium sp. NCHU2750]